MYSVKRYLTLLALAKETKISGLSSFGLEIENLTVQKCAVGQLWMEGCAKNMLLFQADRFPIERRDYFDARADLLNTRCAYEAEWVLTAIIERFKAVELTSPAISRDGCVQPTEGLLFGIPDIFGE